MFDAPWKLLLGLVTGVVFGVLLQKGQVAKHRVIVGQLLLRDFTVLKIMLTAIAVGSVGVFALVALGVTAFELKPAALGALFVGALGFGTGLAVLGYCPGTTVAAAGQGNRDALPGLVGMLFGAFAYVFAFPAIEGLRGAAANFGKAQWPGLTHSPPLLWLGIVTLCALSLYAYSRRQRQSRLQHG